MRDFRLYQRFIRFSRKPAGITLAVAACWQVVMLTIGYIIDPSQGALGHMIHWDAGWYQHILEYTYGENGSAAAPAFYPLYPFLIFVLPFLSFGFVTIPVSALLINTICLWLSLLALVKILQHFSVKKEGQIISVAFLLSFPSAFFMHTLYTESLFVALSMWAYLCALQKKWWIVGALLALATATRLPSVLLILLCYLEYLRSYGWNLKKSVNPSALWFMLAPIGFIAYGAYLYIIREDFLAMFHAYTATNDWTYHVFSLNIPYTLWSSLITGVSGLLQYRSYEYAIHYVLPILSLMLLMVCSVFLYLKKRSQAVPLSLYGIASIALFSINSNVISSHRYSLAVIIIYIAAGVYASTRYRRAIVWLIISVLFVIQIFLFSKFVHGIFAG